MNSKKIKCKKCGQMFEIPKGNCPICFSDILGELSDIKDDNKRIDELTIFINELTNFDYERGFHNAKCINQLRGENVILGCEFEEYINCNHKCIKNGIADYRADCSICVENPDNDVKDLQKAGRSYKP